MTTDHADPAEPAALRAASPVGHGGQPALGWESVHAFGAEHGTVLPEPYRSFETSDGWASGPPRYGLLPVAELPRDWGDDGRDLGKPSPLTEPWLWEDDPEPSEEDDDVLDQVYHHGSLVLGTDGCAMNWHLVVTGPHRGHVWRVSDAGAAPFGSEFGSTTAGSGFAGRVRHWAVGKPWTTPCEGHACGVPGRGRNGSTPLPHRYCREPSCCMAST